MKIRVGINGFGRIGRSFFRAAISQPDIEVVAINDLAGTKTCAHLLQYDSLRGQLPEEITFEGDSIVYDGRLIKTFQESDPAKIDWANVGVDVVLEATGKLIDIAGEHLKGGAKKVIISCPAPHADGTFVMGINEDIYNPQTHHVISNASCTVNCMAMMVKVLDEAFGVQSGLITNIHSVSRQQGTQDADHKDLRMARAAGYNMVPHHPGASRVLGQVMPKFQNKINDYTLRVPVPIGSMIDLTVQMPGKHTVEEVNAAMKQAATTGRLAPYFEYTDAPIVSTDIISNPASCIFDAGLTQVMGDQVRVVGWHDNEWGYANRLVDLVAYTGNKMAYA